MSKNKSLEALVNACFSGSKGLVDIKSAYLASETQINYASDVVSTLLKASNNCPSVAVLEADTGTGKTLGYLIPTLLWAALNKKRVLLSVYTNYLQQQISLNGGDLDVVLELVERLTGARLSVAIRYGMSHFVARSRARALLTQIVSSQQPLDTQSDALVQQFFSWLDNDEFCLLSDWSQRFGDLPLGLSELIIGCTPDDSTEELASYRMSADAAKKADIVVIPHVLLVHNVFKKGGHFDGGKPINAIIIDEADKLYDVALSMNTHTVSLNTLSLLAGHANNECEREVRLFDKHFEELFSLMESLRINNNITRQFHVDKLSTEDVKHLLNKLRAVYKYGRAITEVVEMDLLPYDSMLSGLFSFTQALNRNKKSFTVPLLSYSQKRQFPSLSLVPSGRVAPLLSYVNNKLFDSVDALIITSATLTGGSAKELDFLLTKMGMQPPAVNVVAKSIYSPLKFGSMKITLSGPAAPLPFIKDVKFNTMANPQWLDHVAAMILAAADNNERVLVLCLSYEEVGLLSERLSTIESRLIVHSRQISLKSILGKFAESKDDVLLSPSAWEGVNLPGIIDNLVITRIPFAPPDSTSSNAIQYSMKRSGYQPNVIKKVIGADIQLSAAKKLRQGIGRGIRFSEDHVHLWICDPRFPSPVHKARDHPFTRSFLKTLPERFHDVEWRSASIFNTETTTEKPKNPW